MTSDAMFFAEMVLLHGAVLGWAFWELYALRRDKRRRASAERAGHPEGEQSPHRG
jgi:hypothetical protein